MKTRDDQLTELLDSMPRVTATETFTSTLMTRVESRSPRRYASRRRRRLAAAVALVGVGLLAAVVGLRGPSSTPPVKTAEVQDLIEQQRQIEAELSQLRRLAAEAAPVAYVAGDEHVDIVLDLRNVDGSAAAVRPAVYKPKED
jgi:hypothetical protein